MVHAYVLCIIIFAVDESIYDMLIQRNVIVGTNTYYAKHLHLKYGAYVQSHKYNNNLIMSQTTGAIYLLPTRKYLRCYSY